MIAFDSVITDALEEVLALVEQKFGANARVPDALTSVMLLASLQNKGGGWVEVSSLVNEGVLDPCYRDVWKVYFTGNPQSILDPDVPPAVHEATAWAATAAGFTATIPVQVPDITAAAAPTTPTAPDVVGPLAESPDLAAAVPTGTVPIWIEAPKEATA